MNGRDDVPGTDEAAEKCVLGAMGISNLNGSGGYAGATEKVAGWMARLSKGGADEAAKVRDEKSAFFAAMRKTRPDLYAAFQVDDKALSEQIYFKITGRRVVID
jgi:hypothetical protein